MLRFIAPSVQAPAKWLWQIRPDASPKWRSKTLPGRWMRPGGISSRMINEMRVLIASKLVAVHWRDRPVGSNPEIEDEEETVHFV